MRKIVFGLLLMGAGAAQAHPPLPDVAWCSGGRPMPVGSFQFSPQQVQDYANCLYGGICNGAPAPTTTYARGSGGNCTVEHCGQFDDDYNAARRMAGSQCSAYAQPWARGHNPDWGTVVELIDQPGSYNAEDHHTAYRAMQGLAGQCARCEDRPAISPPIPVN
jgi:hypothetical protein